MTALEPQTEPPWKPSRAQLIRELVAAGYKNKDISRWCVEAGYESPSPSALHRARTYETKGRPPPTRPSYYTLCKEYLEAHSRAVSKGLIISMTREMKVLLDLMERCILQDKMREPLTPRRVRKKRKAKPKP